jgi:nicotinic acid mononucleotide adenylyltransferase
MASSPSDVYTLLPATWSKTAAQIHASGRQLVIALTGGGSGAIGALLQTAGASRAVLEAIVPYSLAALADWIGGKPDQACSDATARAMAVAAFERARQLAPEAEPQAWLGVGATASLATDRPKRGARRIHLAYQTHDRTWIAYHSLDPMAGSRSEDERASAELVLSAIAKGCGVYDPASQLTSATGRGVLAPDEQIDLMLGKSRRIVLQADSDTDYFDEGAVPAIGLVFPGAFNPVHAGHARMAELAERRNGTRVTWEISVTNVDKPPLDYISIDERVDALRRAEPHRLIALTRAPTFWEKAELFPGATFIVGADTIARIADPSYYGVDLSLRDEAVSSIARQRCRFLVFGREGEGRFKSLAGLELPAALRDLCDEVPEAEFREDVSSTELREEAEHSRDA